MSESKEYNFKKIEEKWINNDFKVSEKEVTRVLEN